MTKILYVTQFFPSATEKQTGGTISNLNLLRALGERHDVHVLTFDPGAHPSKFSGEPFRVTQRIPPAWRWPGILLHWLPFVRRETHRIFTEEGSPAILFATTSSIAAFDVAPSCTRTIAIVRAFENFGFSCPWVPRRSRINLGKIAILHRLQDKRLLRRCDVVITNSRFMKNVVAARFGVPGSHIHIAPQLVDISPLPKHVSPDTIGFVNRGPDKNLELIIKMAVLAKDLTFLVYGHRDGFPDDPPENMIFKGWCVDRNQMFASAALWLVPSLWAEPFGRVSIEAQAAERAVLVANTGGLPETVRFPAQVVSGYDPVEWVGRVREALRVPPEVLEETGREIREMYSPQRHFSAISKIVGGCITPEPECKDAG